MSVLYTVLQSVASGGVGEIASAAASYLSTRGIASEYLFGLKSVKTLLPFAVSGVSRGMSVNAILTSARAGGLKISNRAGSALIGVLRSDAAAPSVIRGGAKGRFPAVSLWKLGGPSQRRKYNYVYSLTGTNFRTGERVATHVTIASDDVLTLTQARDMASELIVSSESGSGIEQPSLRLVRIAVSPGEQMG